MMKTSCNDYENLVHSLAAGERVGKLEIGRGTRQRKTMSRFILCVLRSCFFCGL